MAKLAFGAPRRTPVSRSAAHWAHRSTVGLVLGVLLAALAGCTSGKGSPGPAATASSTGGSAGSDGGSGGSNGGSGDSNGGSGGSNGGGGSGGQAAAPFECSDNSSAGAAGSPDRPDNLQFEVLPTDWAIVVGTGQSLAVGVQGAISTTTQPYNNLTLAFGAAELPPFDPDDPELSLVPLVEPVHLRASTYPSAYPANISGETPHTAMSIQVSALVEQDSGDDYVTVHSVVGESGQPMSVINKDAVEVVNGSQTMGRAYQATLFEAQAIQRLAGAQNKSVGVGAIVLTHGESDTGKASYGDDLVKLWADYNEDLRAITGQSIPIPMLISQQHSVPDARGTRSLATQHQWTVGLGADPGSLICTGPKYQYPYANDGVHLIAQGYRLLGEKVGQVYFERAVLGNDWRPLYPVRVEQCGRRLDVQFHVPVPPLLWDDELPAPHQAEDGYPEWRLGKGFEVRSGAQALEIESVEIISDDVVRITCAAAIPEGAMLGYAATTDGVKMDGGTVRWGLLRDSDPFVGAVTEVSQPNFSVAFELPIE